ncbi:MAG: hypothetical protein M3N98_16440 [Actinomycetota bacterium]|nr:hypothetical protein [Actinomycetota bacterium]
MIVKVPVLVRAALAVVVLAALTLVGGYLAGNVILVDLSILLSVLAAVMMLVGRRLTAGSSRRQP